MFPSLIGRLKTGNLNPGIIPIDMFPSLIGRLKTLYDISKLLSIIIVSIPHRKTKNYLGQQCLHTPTHVFPSLIGRLKTELLGILTPLPALVSIPHRKTKNGGQQL